MTITPADVARIPAPGMAVPVKISFSSDGKWLAWLHSPKRNLVRELHLHSVDMGETKIIKSPATKVAEDSLSLEEKLRRERTRDVGQGTANYFWAQHGSVLIVPTSHQVWEYDVDVADWKLLLDLPESLVIDPRLSPDGEKLAWVQDGELFSVSLTEPNAVPVMISTPTDGTTHGLAEFVAQEEMGRSQGYWWSSDSKKLAFVEVDESHIPAYRIVHQGSPDINDDSWEEHSYPFAGKDNAIVKLFVAEIDGATEELYLGDFEYLARVDWAKNGDLFVQVEDRQQSRLDLLRFHQAAGKPLPVHVEESDVWINLHNDFRFLADGSFIWTSERTGFRHIEIRNNKGELTRTLTSGSWMVHEIKGVDESSQTVYFTAGKEHSTERHLYSVGMLGGEITRLTNESGCHQVVVNDDSSRFADLFSSIKDQPSLGLFAIDGKLEKVLFADPDSAVAELELSTPTLTTIKTDDAESLQCAIFEPEGKGPFPTIVHVYGGPHAQLVVNSWSLTAMMRPQYLRQLGFCVVIVDGRGSWGRGLSFEGAIKHNLGDLEVSDQVAAIEQLAAQSIVDKSKVAIYGWSYGGYMAAMSLARRPDVFKAAAAGAPVTHWDGYDTHYTERYMGTPSDNANGYETSSVMTHAKSITGKLMLVHGLLDENVHFRHSARLINALIQNNVHYELLMYPNERHLPRGHADRTHMEVEITRFLTKALEEQ